MIDIKREEEALERVANQWFNQMEKEVNQIYSDRDGTNQLEIYYKVANNISTIIHDYKTALAELKTLQAKQVSMKVIDGKCQQCGQKLDWSDGK